MHNASFHVDNNSNALSVVEPNKVEVDIPSAQHIGGTTIHVKIPINVEILMP